MKRAIFKAVLTSVALTAIGATSLASAQDKGTIGISMPTKSSSRWIADGDNMVKVLKERGYKTDLQYAEDDIPNQLAQIENMITKGAKVLVIASIDGTTLSKALQNAADKGVKVIAYDRLIKGSKNVEPEQHTSIVASVGGQANAYTNEDTTVFWQTIPSQFLPLVLWMEADRMATLRIEQETFVREREVVKEERRMRIENQPYGRLNEIIYEQAFTTHPYRHPVIGSMEDLNAATLAGGRDFSFIVRQLGVDEPSLEPETAIFPSPFVFEEQAVLAVPTDLTPPNADPSAHRTGVLRVVHDLADTSDGGLFVLFTSHREVRHAVCQRVGFASARAGDDQQWTRAEAFPSGNGLAIGHRSALRTIETSELCR